MIEVLAAKIRYAMITGSSKFYMGSITIDKNILEKLGLKQWQKVEVNGHSTKERVSTYIIEGEAGSGKIEINGGLAQYFNVGDIVHINAFKLINETELAKHNPIIIEKTF